MVIASSLAILAILLFLHFLAGKRPPLSSSSGGVIAAEHVNTGRQFEIDLAKAISVIWMILVHVDEECYKGIEFAPGLETGINLFIEFAGGPLAAPIFMMAMGIGLAYSNNQTAPAHVARGIKLIGQGYLLNIMRGALPCLFFSLLYHSESLLHQSIKALLCLDILHFAGLTFLFFALMKRCKCSNLFVAFTALAMLTAGSITTPTYPEQELPSVWIGYFIYQNPLTPFPFFVWLIYPAIGYLFGKVLLRVADKTRFYGRLLIGGVVLCGCFSAVLLANGVALPELFIDDNMYAQNTVKVLWVLGIAALWCGLLYFLSLVLVKKKAIKKLVVFMSKKINAVFITQWILIGWMAAGGFFNCPVYGGKFLFFFVSIALVTVALVYFEEFLKTWWSNRKRASTPH